LTTLPGVGQCTALVMLAETGDITRFPRARKLASWAGLTPTVHGSDRTVRHRHISKQGPAWLRWVMNQAAPSAKRSPEFAATDAAIAQRRGTKIATIAISRTLLTRAWHLLATQASTRPSARHPPPRQPRRPAGSPSPGHARSCGMRRPAAALDHLTEQPGPRTSGHGDRAPARRRMGACQPRSSSTAASTAPPSRTRTQRLPGTSAYQTAFSASPVVMTVPLNSATASG
jgi:hypothetical protein